MIAFAGSAASVFARDGSGAVWIFILNKRSLRSEGSGRAARSVALFATQ